ARPAGVGAVLHTSAPRSGRLAGLGARRSVGVDGRLPWSRAASRRSADHHWARLRHLPRGRGGGRARRAGPQDRRVGGVAPHGVDAPLSRPPRPPLRAPERMARRPGPPPGASPAPRAPPAPFGPPRRPPRL